VLRHGLFATAPLWAPLEQAHAWVVQAAQILANDGQADGAAVATAYRGVLNEMLAH
jgi:Zn-dependent metalloprotease